MKTKYYSLKNILSRNALYNVIIGERSNGKTYAALEYGLKQYFNNGGEMAIIRRWNDDFRGKRGATVFTALENNGVITKLSRGEWTGVYYWGGRWYFCRYTDENKLEKSEKPFCYAFSLTAQEHDKSSSYPNIQTIIFDEFLTRGMYLPDEFILFMNCLSTIIRDRDNVKIFMLGNTVNQYSPYFSEMGLEHIKSMKQGDIDLYTYGNSGLTVAVEFSDSANKKPSNKYFAFDNPRLQMITGVGNVWELDIYPHCPCKYAPKDILYTYFIKFDGNILQCEIIMKNNGIFTYIHKKTTELQNRQTDIIYSPEDSTQPNYFKYINRPVNNLQQQIYQLFTIGKIFYQDNKTGEIVRNYLLWCKK